MENLENLYCFANFLESIKFSFSYCVYDVEVHRYFAHFTVMVILCILFLNVELVMNEVLGLQENRYAIVDVCYPTAVC